MGYIPLSAFFVPLRVFEDSLNLISSHEDPHDGLVFLDLLLLVANSIEKFLLLLFVLILDILKFD
jgi:hypothetical protein